MLLVHACEQDEGKRLDAFLHERLPEYSRSRIHTWIKDARVQVDGRPAKPSATLRGTESIEVDPAGLKPLVAQPENIPLDVLYEDEYLVAINKAAGMVVHAGAGVNDGTVVNALLHRFETLSALGGEMRPGIVHRLDRFTSGVLLVAKTDPAHQALATLFATRRMRKNYLTVVHGAMQQPIGRIEKPIARDPVHRTRMTTRVASGRPAWSEWRVLETFEHFTYLDVLIGTGRTHQIRVHLASIHHAVAGDTLYGAPAHIAGLPDLGHYFLHAHQIAFEHPFSGEQLKITAPLAPELSRWLDFLRGQNA